MGLMIGFYCSVRTHIIRIRDWQYHARKRWILRTCFWCPGKQRLFLCSDALSHFRRERWLLLGSNALANADYFLVLIPCPICCWAPQVPLSAGHDGSLGFLHSYLRGSQAGHRGRGGQPSRGGHLIGSAGICEKLYIGWVKIVINRVRRDLWKVVVYRLGKDCN